MKPRLQLIFLLIILTTTLAGCLHEDTDGDGIRDAKDECPEQPGSDELDGCPDSDGDGFSDKEEEEAGSLTLNPESTPDDTDGDGYTNDYEEACRSVPWLGAEDEDHFGMLDSGGYDSVTPIDVDADGICAALDFNDNWDTDHEYWILVGILLVGFWRWRRYMNAGQHVDAVDGVTILEDVHDRSHWNMSILFGFFTIQFTLLPQCNFFSISDHSASFLLFHP